MNIYSFRSKGRRALRGAAFMLAACLVWTLGLSAAAQAAVASAQAQRKTAAEGTQLARLLRAARTIRPIHLPALPPAKLSSATLRAIRAHGPQVPAPTLLDEVGALARHVRPAEAAAWRAELHGGRVSGARAATLHLWLGEWALAHDQQPHLARLQFFLAQKSVGPRSPLYGRAAYDAAIAHMYAGAYGDAVEDFTRLLSPKTSLVGYDRRACALWLRHAGADAGYHADRAAQGIPEPPQLDPACGAAALAAGLRGLGLVSERSAVLARCRVTGEGSTLADLVTAGPRLGAKVRPVTADDQGLEELPKPLIAHVEHDHFIVVVRADRRGVAYLCSDCGPWPGGEVSLTWRQWHALEPDVYATVTRPGSIWDRAVASLPIGPAAPSGMSRGLLVASAGRLTGLTSGHLLTLLPGLRGHAFLPLAPVRGVICGNTGHSQHPTPNRDPPYNGDPVNLTTGEENYAANPDLVVYNPHGPSVSWTRLYNSLRSTGQGNGGLDGTYEDNDYGIGWSQGYNVSVYDPTVGGTGTKYVVLPDSSRYAFIAPSVPAAGEAVPCQVEAGAPLLVEWDADAYGNGYYVITSPDRTKMVTTALDSATDCCRLAQIVDRDGHAVTFHYGDPAAGCAWPLLSSITNEDGTALLSVQRATDGTGNVVAVSDCYGRSVYYHDDVYPTLNVPPGYKQSYQELDRVSQIVPTGSGQCPDRCVYGYEYVSNLEGQEQVVFLHQIETVNPSGAAAPSVLTIDYDPTTDFVADQTDADGVTSSYAGVNADGSPAVVSNYEQVTVTGATGGVVQTSVVGYDNNLCPTTNTDGVGQPTSATTHADANDPYAPSSVTDAHGVTASATYDAVGNVLTSTSARGTVTQYTYDYSHFALGELVSVQEGANLATPKAPTTFTYSEPSGLPATVTGPAPGTAGGGGTVTASYTYNAYGDPVTVTAPGNNAASSISASYDYGSSPAQGLPLAVSTPAGTSHFTYDAQGRALSETDALGNETDHFALDGQGHVVSGYNIAGQPLATVLPATGQQGAGRSYSLTNYLYPGGPATGSALYDEAGTLIRQVGTTYGPAGETLAAAGTTQSVGYVYDALYRLTALTDGNGHTTHYVYNAAGYLTSVAYPRANAATGYDTTTSTYDAAGYLTRTVDGRGVEADFGYEPSTGALSTVQFPAQAALNEQYAYDPYGRTTAIADGSGSRSFAYDDGDRAVSVSTQYAGLPAEAIGYGYYPDGSRSSMTTPGGNFAYSYDAAGRLTGLTNPFGETSTWGYRANNWLAAQTLGNGIQTVYSQDPLGRLARLTNQTTGGGGVAPAVLSDFTVPSQAGYDGAGDRLGVTATLPAAPNSFSGQTAYAYDPLGRLTGEQSTRGSGATTSYGLDGGASTGAGDLTSLRGQGHSFNADNQDTSNTYDGAGNPTTYAGQSLTFDAESRMTAFGSTLSATYRADGLRASKTTGSGTTWFLYDGADPVCELSASGAVTAVNTFGGAGLLSRHTAQGSTFYTFDERGNVTQRLDGSGSPLSTDLYDAYGAKTSTAASQPDPFGFGGQDGYYTDSETGLILCGHRYYDPAAGRFINRDPIGYAGGLNLYAYCADNPITNSDPFGLRKVYVYDPQHSSAPAHYSNGYDTDITIPGYDNKSYTMDIPDNQDVDVNINLAKDFNSQTNGDVTKVLEDKEFLTEQVANGSQGDYGKNFQAYPDSASNPTLELQRRLGANFNYGAMGAALGYNLPTLLGIGHALSLAHTLPFANLHPQDEQDAIEDGYYYFFQKNGMLNKGIPNGLRIHFGPKHHCAAAG